ncbi:MAG: hypothetical protein V1754_05020 [Pseudomonadota bacterium]
MFHKSKIILVIILFFCTSLFNKPVFGIVLNEDELEDRSTELGMLLRTFSFLFHGSILRPPYSPISSDPSGAGLFDLRLSFCHRTPKLKAALHTQLTGNISSHATLGAFNLGRGIAPPRWIPLQTKLVDDPTLMMQLEIDWIFLSYTWGPITITAGRQPITFGRGKLWHPSDLVSNFGITEVDVEFKPGADAMRLDWTLSPKTFFTIVTATGELQQDTDMELSLRGSSFIGRFSQGWEKGEAGVWTGLVRWDIVLGVDAVHDFGKFDMVAEVTLTFPTEKSLTPRAEIDSGIPAVAPLIPRAVLGATFKPMNKLFLTGELFFNGFGSWEKETYLALATSERIAVGEMATLGKLYAGILADWEAHPLVHLYLISFANLRDPSGLLSLGLRYNLATNVELYAGGYVPVARLPNIRAGFEPRSEFGFYPYFLFLELKAAI